MEDTQLLKGILEGCVLAIIRRGETYGYEILSSLEKEGFDNLIEGTLYPVLTRMEKKGFIICRIGKSPLGPKRKYYSITAEGEQWLKDFTMQYQTVTRKADNILLGEINYENE